MEATTEPDYNTALPAHVAPAEDQQNPYLCKIPLET